jgi:hypothetical protein
LYFTSTQSEKPKRKKVRTRFVFPEKKRRKQRKQANKSRLVPSWLVRLPHLMVMLMSSSDFLLAIASRMELGARWLPNARPPLAREKQRKRFKISFFLKKNT